MTLPTIPIRDYRAGGMLAYVRDHADGAARLLETVLRGLGPVGVAGRPFLSGMDRLANRRLDAMQDPYRDEIVEIARIIGTPGPIAFSLSYEFGCTARVFPDQTLFRTLDWPFRGLGELIEIVLLPGRAGDWITATWPGVVGALQGAAPGRFAAALNQAPERRSSLGRAASWIAAKRRFLGADGIPPPHLLRQVFEEAETYEDARSRLRDTPVAAPVIYTLVGPEPGEACVIERTEDTARITEQPAAANHFATALELRTTWRSRGFESEARRRAALALATPPALDALEPPILNPLTRLAVTITPDGALAVAGYDGSGPLTEIGQARIDAS